MKKRLLVWLCSILLSTCCMGLVACSSANETQDPDTSAETASEVDGQSEDTASNGDVVNERTDRFLGAWQTAGYAADGITITGDLDSVLGSGLGVTLEIEQGGSGMFSYMDEDYPVDWHVTGDTLSIATAVQVTGEDILLGHQSGSIDESDYIALDFSYDDESLILPLSESEQLILTKDGTIADMPAISIDDFEPIASADDILGTWKICSIAMGDTTFYGSGAYLFQAVGMDIEDEETATLSFEEDGIATFLGGELEWGIEDDKLFIADPEVQIPVASLGDRIAVDVSSLSDSPDSTMIMVFSK